MRRILAAAISLSIVLTLQTPAWAWGRLGHRVISRLAEQHLTDKAKAGIRALLDKGESIADASTWADQYRSSHRKTAPWHYVDAPLDGPAYDAKWSGDDPRKGRVVDKIKEFKPTLKDKTKTAEERRLALRFLIHFVEDMHQPCHVGDNKDRGGNDTQVRFFKAGTKMHSLWDGGLLARMSDKEDYWLTELTALPSSQTPDDAAAGTVEDSSIESLLAAREAYADPATGKRIKSGAKSGPDYHDKNIPVVKERMYLAAIPLAAVLNECVE